MHREPKNNNDDTQYEALKACQNKCVKNNDIQKDPSVFFSLGSTVVVQWEDGPNITKKYYEVSV